MNLEQQLKTLIDEAPQYGIDSVVIQRAVAPVLESCARQLQHLEYYILQNLDEDWVLMTINNPQQQQKKVIYAFSSVQDAATFQNNADPSIFAAPIPVTHLLFRIFSLQQIDSIVFLDRPGDLNSGIEIGRERLVESIQRQLIQLQSPPDLA